MSNQIRSRKRVKINWPDDKEKLLSLLPQTYVEISGEILTARDQAHKKLVELVNKGKELPISLSESLIYYCGPTPAPPDKVIGSCGPTTSSRMDKFLEPLLRAGLKATMGKGMRSYQAWELIKRYGAVYLITIGGAGAFLAQFVKAKEIIAFPELGAEAIHRLTVKDFPAIKW